MASPAGLLTLPTEVLQHILLILSTPSYLQTSLVCKQLYHLASASRTVVLHHLQTVPGIKIGLDDPTVPTTDLFLLFRQRASKHLYGANFTADCRTLRPRNARIDADISFMSNLDYEYVTMALVFKDTLTVRLYTTQCALKERILSPYCGGKAKILQVVNRKPTIAVLYQWEAEEKQKSPPWIEKPLVEEHPHKKANDLTAAAPPDSDSEESGTDEEVEPLKKVTAKKFHLQFYDWMSSDRPLTYTIEQHKDLVPRHLAVHSRLIWAVLWDVEGSVMPTTECTIVQYTTPKRPVSSDQTSYDSRVVWPNEFDPAPTVTPGDIAKGMITKLPRKIAFFKEGRRLSLYAAGDVVPFKVIGVGSLRESRSPTNSIYFENRTFFQIDTAFYGKHEPYWDPVEGRQICNLTHLCLGVGEIRNPFRKCTILCILRSRTKTDHDDCPHVVLENRMPHVSAENCKAVARLWGWSEMSNTLTGLDTVVVSKHGTRIAVAQWDRVLVWSLDPKILCEDVADFDSDDDTKKPKKKKKIKAKGVAEDFYQRTKDPHMGWKIANLKPVVLDLHGAVARKMAWTIPYERSEDDSDDENGSTEDPSTAGVAGEPASQDQNQNTSIDLKLDQTVTTPEMNAVNVVIDPVSTAMGHDGELESGAKNELDDSPKQSRAESKEQIGQFISKVELVDVISNKGLPDRNTAPSSQRARYPPITEKLLPIYDTTLALESPTSNALLGPDDTGVSNTPDPNVVEAMPSPLDKPATEPKGKEKETDAAAIAASNDSTIPITRSTSGPGEAGGSTSNSVSQAKVQDAAAAATRKKRFTEDELVIMTDQGFQIWDFGIWGKRLRAQSWLEEEY